MLGLARIQLDGFLKSHGIYQDYTSETLGGLALKELGLLFVRLVMADTGLERTTFRRPAATQKAVDEIRS